MYHKEQLVIALSRYFDTDTTEWELIESFVSDYLDKVPAPFFSNPASTSGRFHPAFSLGEGGLVRHTIVAMYWADRWANFLQLSERDRAVALVATCIHDTFKGGPDEDATEWPETNYQHGDIGAAKILGSSNWHFAFSVAEAVRTHMGVWAEPNASTHGTQTPTQQCVAMADYAAAQKIYDPTVMVEVMAVLEANNG